MDDDHDELHLEMHRAVDELGKFSLHMNITLKEGTSISMVIDFVEDLLIKATNACIEHGADMVGHVKAFMIAENGSTMGASLVHQKMKVNITSNLKGESIRKGELVVHVIVHGIWDPLVREVTMEALEEVSQKHGVTYDIIKDYFETEKSIAHHG